MARAALSEAGGEGTQALQEFAAIREKDAEESCHKLFERYGLSVPVDIHYLHLGLGELARFPCIPFTSWVQHLMDEERTDLLCGVGVDEQAELFTAFWKRFEANHPKHQLFERARQGSIDLSKCLPAFCHLDEGRTYKTKAILIISVHGVLGKGTRPYKRRFGVKKFHIKRNPMPMNYMGSSWSNQFMFCSLLKSEMVANPHSFDMVMTKFAMDMAELATAGISSTNGRHHMWVQLIACKGDLPALTKVGNFKRHFLRAPRRAQSKNPCEGICFLCSAGLEVPDHVPFEDYSHEARWRRTCFNVPPWKVRPPILQGIPIDMTQEAAFFQTDMWHNWHNGLAKYFIANAFASFVTTPNIIPGASIETKFQWLTKDYLSFCGKQKFTAYLREINRDTIGLETASSPPQGSWNKAAVSTHLMLYLQDFCARIIEGRTDDIILQNIDSC